MKTPLTVSVAMCTYNGEKYLRGQLESLLNQERQPDELIVCDDGSRDRTLQLLDEFSSVAPFRVVVLVNERSLGVVRNFERAVSQCTSDAIFLCDQDDVWYPKKLRVMTAELENDPGVALVVSNNRLVDADGTPCGAALNWEACGFDSSWQSKVQQGDAFRVLSFHSPLSGHAMAFRRSLARYLCPFPADFHHDRWIALVASALGRVVLIPEALNDYRQHHDNLVGGGDSELSLVEQAIRHPRMARNQFLQKAQVYAEAKQRLTALATLPASALSEKASYLDELIAFNRARYEMGKGTLRRFALVATQILSRRYWSCGRGWLTVARDLVG